jgi:hypothetical protein
MSILGSVPSHSYFGVPVSGQRPAGQQAGSRLAAGSGPYLGSRGNKCMANEDTCKGNRVTGKELCAGHLRSEAKRQAKEEELKSQLMSLGDEEVDDGV